MLSTYKYKTLTTLSILLLLASGCSGSTTQNENQIATAVAQTVQAQDSLTEVAAISILATSTIPAEIPSTPDVVGTNTSSPVGADPGCVVSASLIGETPPDETILKPGEYFWKTWTLKNTGTCIWNSSYKLIFWSGDLMDGLVEYALPDIFVSGDQKDISIYLKAPANDGTYAGYWKIQTPWGASFGVGQYDEPIYVEVVVSGVKRPDYDITSVDFSLVRDPETGCPPNVYYTLNAIISTSGPLDILYHWNASGSLFTQPKLFTFESAQTKTLSYTIGINKQSTKPTDYWILFTIDDPKGQDFKRIYVNHTC